MSQYSRKSIQVWKIGMIAQKVEFTIFCIIFLDDKMILIDT